jgi:hypothetical protein
MRIVVMCPVGDARAVTTEVDVPWSACTGPLGFDIDFEVDASCTAMHHKTMEGGCGRSRSDGCVLVYGDAFKGQIKLEAYGARPRISAPSLGPDITDGRTLVVYDAVALGIIPAFGMAPCMPCMPCMQRVRLTWARAGAGVPAALPAYDLGLSPLSSSATGASRAFELRNGLRVCRVPEPHVVELRGVAAVGAVGAVRSAVGGPSPHGWAVIKTSAQHCICVELWRPWEELFHEIPYGVARELDADRRIVVMDASELATPISADVARAFVWRWACGMTWDAAGVELSRGRVDGGAAGLGVQPMVELRDRRRRVRGLQLLPRSFAESDFSRHYVRRTRHPDVRGA